MATKENYYNIDSLHISLLCNTKVQGTVRVNMNDVFS